MTSPPPLRLGPVDAGEVLTLQRAAYVPEARAHGDLDLPPLLETFEQTKDALGDPACFAWGIREAGRLVASVRIVVDGEAGLVGRLIVAPDRQGHGLGSSLLLAAEAATPPTVTVFRLFTGDRSVGPLRMYAKLGYVETHRTPEAHYELVHFEKPRVRSTGPVR
ncbi:GNAT family N-acetyltransferase [Amycolatopsis regifaucium]|uniref:GCN5 family acetyltransferase n=1 Tax=Amycolatopsis regifaucium TaxID=546365 RepID=A0A154MU25_9PSEU|nr:GCN5 family acetyltransferase [Amycolatopsis regifaucium]OKA08475.1 GNAT family N-acetyltransferase [Amycolatopsis regifaucium]